jgi:hypothetical protein
MVRRNSTRKLRGGATGATAILQTENKDPNGKISGFPNDDEETGAEEEKVLRTDAEKKYFPPAQKPYASTGETNAESALKLFRASLASTATGATGPVYGKDLLIDQLYVLNEAMQPLRKITKEMDDLMGMVKMGTSKFLTDHNKNSDNIVSRRIQGKLNAFTKKYKKKNKKVKVSNIKFD